LIKPVEENNTLVQKAATPVKSASTNDKNAAMQKYLKIARQLVKLDASLPSLKLCMADVQAGKYNSKTEGNTLKGKSNVPKALRDPTTGKPMAIIVD
jgi:hypothetical protein